MEQQDKPVEITVMATAAVRAARSAKSRLHRIMMRVPCVYDVIGKGDSVTSGYGGRGNQNIWQRTMNICNLACRMIFQDMKRQHMSLCVLLMLIIIFLFILWLIGNII